MAGLGKVFGLGAQGEAQRCEAWLAALSRGENPFSSEVLEGLRGEGQP
jgi:hypothetical protein